MGRSSIQRVVIVEDSRLIRQRLAAQVSARPGLRVVGEADDAPSAIALIDQLRPDAILLDLRLKRGSGITVLRHVREQALASRVIVLTNHGANDEYRRQCAELGADGYLDKSLEFDCIADALSAPMAADATVLPPEPMLHAVLRHVKDVIFQADMQGRWTFLSPSWRALTGADPAESIGRHFSEFVHPEDREANVGKLRALLAAQTEHCRHEVRYRQPDGSFRWIEANAMLTRDATSGVPVGVSGSLRDITDRRTAELQLRESEERYRAVVNATYDGILVMEGGLVRDINTGFTAMMGYEAGEVLGRPVLDFVAPESREAVAERLAGGREGKHEARVLTRDGRTLHVKVMATMMDIGGRRQRVAALRDVTLERDLERQFIEAQRREAVALMAASVAHDFNNILAGALAGVELLAELAGQAGAEELAMVRATLQRGGALTRRLLSLSRPEGEAARLDLNAVVRDLEGVLRLALGNCCVLALSLDTRPMWLRADANALEHLLLNLATNARDAMPEGGVLSITTDASPTVLTLTVADTGCGMTPDVLERAFDLLFTTKAAGRGTGLGLPSVRRTVERFGGALSVTSEPGRGTRFVIRWPVAHE